ncbi:MAG: hypothetical protein HXX20_19865 [Chloroflexi bacterium]|nr:hypothetical protein [Chloroflexota bacterium]
MRTKWRQKGAFLLLFAVLLSLISSATALAADPDFRGNNAFLFKWQRTDKPIAEGRSSRSWLWGPTVIQSTSENYADSPGGSRAVVYLDKARMEINDPTKNFVTNGLLVRELISGQLALGDNKIENRQPADLSLAGDPGNPGPTYATFRKVSTLNNTDNNASNREGQAVDDTITRDGTLGKTSTLSSLTHFSYYDSNLKHNIPEVFMKFLNQRGVIWDGSKFVDEQAVFDWVDAMGFPISEPYWSQVVVGGQPKDVLIQAFQRRVLTYTPSNATAFQVEMGNVGQHYLSWRNDSRYDSPIINPTPTNPPSTTPTNPPSTTPTNPPSTTPPTPVPTAATPPIATGSGSFSCITTDIPKDNYVFVTSKCGPAGFQQIAVAVGMTGGEAVQATFRNAQGQVVGAAQSFQADATGVLNIQVDVPLSATPGLYKLNLQGMTSGKMLYAYFKVTLPYAVPTIALLPNSGNAADLFVAMVVGFSPNERIQISYTSPSGEVSFPATSNHTTSSTGAFTNALSPKYDFHNVHAGNWVIQATSLSNPNKSAAATISVS